jgi:hypothetical protein
LLPELHIIAPPPCAEIENCGVVPDIAITGWVTSDVPDPMVARALHELARSTNAP